MDKERESVLLSLVVPLYNESNAVDLFFQKILPILVKLKINFEIIAVDDGSTDQTFDKLKTYRQKHPEIKILKLLRNFGKEAALTAGIDYAKGQCLIPMDADLQDPPELIPEMLQHWQAGYKNVVAVRKKREGDHFVKRISATLYYKIFNYLTENTIEANAGDFRLIDREVIDAVRQLQEKNRFMKGLLAWPGGSKKIIYYERPERSAGFTKWNYWKLWHLSLDGIFTFSSLPLQAWTYIGSLISFLAFLYLLYIVGDHLFFGVDVSGYSSIMATILFLGGVQLISIGILGEYIARIFNESKNRPIYLIEKFYDE